VHLVGFTIEILFASVCLWVRLFHTFHSFKPMFYRYIYLNSTGFCRVTVKYRKPISWKVLPWQP